MSGRRKRDAGLRPSGVADQYHEGHLAKLSSGEELWLRVKDDLFPEWQNLPIRDLTRGGSVTFGERCEVGYRSSEFRRTSQNA